MAIDLKKKQLQSFIFYIGIPALVIILMVSMVNSFRSASAETKVYSDIVKYFEDGQVKEYKMNLGSGDMELKLKNDETVKYKVPSVTWLREDIKEHVANYNKSNETPMKQDLIRASENAWWTSILFDAVVTLGILALFWFLMRKTMSGLGDGGRTMMFGKAKIKNMSDEKRKTTFADVAGADEEKEELKELVEFLKNPKKYNDLGARIPKGVLLVGPPGTGKTLMARAIAGEAGVPFFSISGSDFVEMFVGVGASRVRDLFEQAKKNSPCIIFIDEIDAVGRQRGIGISGGHDEREQTLNQLLVEMDGFGINEGVIMIAATNRPDVLDPALLRPGRFDRQVMVGYPDIKGREDILKVHTKGKPLAPDVTLSTIAKSTAGFTGADLENLLNEAALLAARRNLRAITMKEIEEATIKVVVGAEKKSRVMTDKEKSLTAYHEAGHAIATYMCPTQDPVHQISIIPRGMAGGFTMSLPSEDRNYKSMSEMKEDIVVCLGGRVAEALVLGDISTGASNDIQKATKVANSMVKKYGMSKEIGPIAYVNENDESLYLGNGYGTQKDYSEQLASKIDMEIHDIIAEGYDKAEKILKENMEKLHEVAQFLLKNEKMTEEEFEEVMKGKKDIVSSDKLEEDNFKEASKEENN